MTLRLVDGQIVETTGPRLQVSFYEYAKKVGIGKFVSVDFVSVKSPGQRDFMSRPATEQDKKNYPAEWEAYQNGLERQNANTTPLSALPAFKSAFGLELGAKGIHTVEELALEEACPVEGMESLWKQAKRYQLLLEEDHERTEDQAISQP